MTDRLSTVALNEVRALRREMQALKNRMAAYERAVAPAVEREPVEEKPRVIHKEPFPRHVYGTKGRGVKYRLSDGSVVKASKTKAMEAEKALHA